MVADVFLRSDLVLLDKGAIAVSGESLYLVYTLVLSSGALSAKMVNKRLGILYVYQPFVVDEFS